MREKRVFLVGIFGNFIVSCLACMSYETLYETDIFYYLRQTYKINVQNTKNENTIINGIDA